MCTTTIVALALPSLTHGPSRLAEAEVLRDTCLSILRRVAGKESDPPPVVVPPVSAFVRVGAESPVHRLRLACPLP